MVWLVGRLAAWCVALTGLALSALFVQAGVETVGVAWPVTHPEGATIAAIVRVRDGEPLYQNFQVFPHVITPYPPVQPLIAGTVGRALGLSVLETTAVARSLTLATSVACVGLIWLAARRAGASTLAALAGAGLFLGLPFLDEWGFSARPDLPAACLSLGAMVLLLTSPRLLGVAAGVAALAFFTKQTAVALPVAAVAWLALTGRWRSAAVFGAIWVALVSATVGVLQVVTGGAYLLNTVYAHLNTPKNGLDFAFRDVQPLVTDAWPTLLLSVFAVPLLRTDRRAALPLLYLLASTALTLFSLRNTGGDVNYLIEPAAAACVPAALALGWLWTAGESSRLQLARALISAVLAGALVVWGLDIAAFWRADGGVNVARLPLNEMAAADTILSEEPLAVLLAGKPLLVSDTFHLSMLATSGFFDPLDLERRIKRSEFDLIVTRSDIRAARLWKRQPLLPEGVRLAIKDTYVQAGRVGIYWLYRPEGRRGR